ncbi:hypothetical protein [Streptomyces melanogenes]|uniref:Secreted protein n=1 Tax=Streptomyces melanogenes TaxID=67326 RepID=A0ABZ1XC07_9ACTN|nr:hypothetical protein [Streptomyces melanogenes]
MQNSGKIAKLAIVAAGMVGALTVCGPTAQAAPTEHTAQISRVADGSWSATVGFSGRISAVKNDSLVLATANGNVTFDLTQGPYRSGSVQTGLNAYVAAYAQNGTWVATAIFTYP